MGTCLPLQDPHNVDVDVERSSEATKKRRNEVKNERTNIYGNTLQHFTVGKNERTMIGMREGGREGGREEGTK